ncbi:MAG: NADH-quinone oxidoreductase subunit A [Alphaproteobacteria bacterium]
MSSFQTYLPVILLLVAVLSIFSYVGILFLRRAARSPKETPLRVPSINRPFFLLVVFLIYANVNLFLLFPWALSFSTLGSFGFWSILLFLSFFLTAFFYAWRKGIFD